MDSSRQMISSFYNQFGIKQYNCFSGGFRYLQKPTVPVKLDKNQYQNNIKTRSDLFREFGISDAKVKTYKLDNDYVPDTKSQLADKLMDKIQHQRKKMRYYREKYYGQFVDKYQDNYRQSQQKKNKNNKNRT